MADRPIDVSVIIATFNVENYVARAIQSALDQTEVSLQIIIVDDCSGDRTWDIVSSFGDPRIRSIQLATNRGPGAARNKGFEVASGKWLAVLDADDSFLPGRLSRCLARAKSSDAEIVVDNVRVHREIDGRKFSMFSNADFARRVDIKLADFIAGNCFFTRGYTLGYLKPVFKADYLWQKNLRYDPVLRIGEDYLLIAEALASGARCAIEPTEGYCYTVRAGSISHRLLLRDIEHMQAADKRLTDRFSFGPAALRAQKRRANSMDKAHNFARLVQAIKDRRLRAALQLIAFHPLTALHLWDAVRVRLEKITTIGRID